MPVETTRYGARIQRPWTEALTLAALRPVPGSPGRTRLNQLAEVVMRKALANGDLHAIEMIGDRIEGRVKLQIDDVKPALDLATGLIAGLVGALVDAKRGPAAEEATPVAATVESMVETKRS